MRSTPGRVNRACARNTRTKRRDRLALHAYDPARGRQGGEAQSAFVDSGKAKLVILRGKGRGRFRAPRRMGTGAGPYGMGGGRLHGDRLTDLAVTNYDDATVSVYLGK